MSAQDIFAVIFEEIQYRIDRTLRNWKVNLSTNVRGTVPGKHLPSTGNTGSGYTPAAHATSHKHGGSDEVATATPGANAIPKAGAGSTLASGWIPAINLAASGAGGVTGILSSANGGTGVDNGGRTLTISTNSGTLAFGAASKILTINSNLTLGGTDGKTLTVSNNLTLAGTDGKTLTLTGSLTIAADTTVAAGAANQIAYWSSASNLANSSTFRVDVANKIFRVDNSGSGTAAFQVGDITNNDVLTIQHTSATQCRFIKNVISGSATIDIDPLPNDNTSAATFRFFRSTNTSGAVSFDVFIGDATGTFNHRIFGKGGHTQLCINNGALLVGRTSGLTGHGDLDVNARCRADSFETAAGNKWKLLGFTAGADAASNGYVSVTIDGTTYKLMTRA